jgi:dTDP-4-amino-4,6-dideoxygalactose transaminase
VAPLLERRESWRYYPPFVYDISFPQWFLGVAGGVITPQKAADVARADLAKVFLPSAPECVVTSLMLKTFFDALLRALDLPPGSEVLWSGASIPHMVHITEHHKLVSRAFDIHMPTFTPALEAADRSINGKTKLMIITPVFGRPLRHVKELVALANRRGILCFIDAAHSIAFKDELLSYGADVTGFSFGCIKFRTAIDGAIP